MERRRSPIGNPKRFQVHMREIFRLKIILPLYACHYSAVTWKVQQFDMKMFWLFVVCCGNPSALCARRWKYFTTLQYFTCTWTFFIRGWQDGNVWSVFHGDTFEHSIWDFCHGFPSTNKDNLMFQWKKISLTTKHHATPKRMAFFIHKLH